MLIPELTLLLAGIALVVALVNSLTIFWARRDITEELKRMKTEQRANQTACYGLARHLQALQAGGKVGMKASGKSMSSDLDNVVNLQEADTLISQGLTPQEIAEELGVSETEAEIISHLRPRGQSSGKFASTYSKTGTRA